MSKILQTWFPAQENLVYVTESSPKDVYIICTMLEIPKKNPKTKPQKRGKYTEKFYFQYHNNKLTVIALGF